jgi:hypothetical protein
MDRLSKPMRAAIVAGAILCAAGAWLGARIYHQMHTPIGVLVIDERQ